MYYNVIIRVAGGCFFFHNCSSVTTPLYRWVLGKMWYQMNEICKYRYYYYIKKLFDTQTLIHIVNMKPSWIHFVGQFRTISGKRMYGDQAYLFYEDSTSF